LPIGLLKNLNESPLGLILKKSCMPKKSTNDLQATHSYAKNTIGTTYGHKRRKWLPLAHIFKFILKNRSRSIGKDP
jgi:hypothetical protein